MLTLDDQFSSTQSTTSPHKIQDPSIIPSHIPSIENNLPYLFFRHGSPGHKLVFEGRDYRGGIPSARRIPMQLLPVVSHISASGFKSDLKNCYYTNISFCFSKTHNPMQLFPVSTLSLLPAYRSVAITNAKHSKSTSLE